MPQVGLPQIAPVNRPIKQKLAPIGAMERAPQAAIFIFQIRNTAPDTAIITKALWAIIAAGT